MDIYLSEKWCCQLADEMIARKQGRTRTFAWKSESHWPRNILRRTKWHGPWEAHSPQDQVRFKMFQRSHVQNVVFIVLMYHWLFSCFIPSVFRPSRRHALTIDLYLACWKSNFRAFLDMQIPTTYITRHRQVAFAFFFGLTSAGKLHFRPGYHLSTIA